MKRGGLVVAGVLLLGILAVSWPSERELGALIVVREPAPGALLTPGSRPPAARLERLQGAGVRLPLERPRLRPEGWLDAVLGGAPPASSLLTELSAEGWTTLLAADDAPELAGRFDLAVDGSVDAALQGLETLQLRPGQPALVVVVLQPADDAAWGAEVGRLIDGVAPRMVPSRTLVAVVDRGDQSAVLVGPNPPGGLADGGAKDPAQLGEALRRWLR